MKTFMTAAASVALVAVPVVLPTDSAQAVDPAKGYTGICVGADALTGTTIVIDFQALNGNGGTAATTLTRCSPNPGGQPRTGVVAMQDAGIAPVGVARWGLGFICRIENRPSAAESLPIAGNPTYKEACVNTPPAAAYWSYWHADGSGSDWTYSNYGAMNRTVTPGGFEGWSFSLNATAATNPKPRVTPRNPAITTSSPSVTLSHNDLDRVITLGQSVTLSWASKNSTKRTASASPVGAGSWSGALAVSGTKTVKPTAKGTYTYRIAATGASSSTAATASLTVK